MKRFEAEKKLNREVKGKNPLVSYYQFHEPDVYRLIGLRIVFYGTAEAYFSFRKSNIEKPFDLAMRFIQDGAPTIIKVDDEEFKFNK